MYDKYLDIDREHVKHLLLDFDCVAVHSTNDYNFYCRADFIDKQ